MYYLYFSFCSIVFCWTVGLVLKQVHSIKVGTFESFCLFLSTPIFLILMLAIEYIGSAHLKFGMFEKSYIIKGPKIKMFHHAFADQRIHQEKLSDASQGYHIQATENMGSHQNKT